MKTITAKPLAISLLALALTACAVGPDYQAPQMDAGTLSSAQSSSYDR